VGGAVDVESETGRWARFTVRTRSSAALLDALLVGAGETRLLVPVDAVADAFPLQGRYDVQRLGGADLLDVDGQLVRLVPLRTWAGEAPQAAAPDACVVLVEQGAQRCALLVDRILGERRVASTDLGPYLSAVPGYSAAAILPDGQVGLVVDVAALIGGLT
jgi:two-component system chemotaxis sensor kinase CheA